jgi:hypothetical protein
VRSSLLQSAASEIERLAVLIEEFPGTCVYCGDGATTVDHLAARARCGENDHVVPACHRCNSILLDMMSTDVAERARYIGQREEHKQRRLLRGVSHDLEDYGPSLRASLAGRMSRRALLRHRLINLMGGGIENPNFVVLEWAPQLAYTD